MTILIASPQDLPPEHRPWDRRSAIAISAAPRGLATSMTRQTGSNYPRGLVPPAKKVWPLCQIIVPPHYTEIILLPASPLSL